MDKFKIQNPTSLIQEWKLLLARVEKIPKVEHAITKIATQKILKLRILKFWGIIKITCYVWISMWNKLIRVK